jgi:plasmid stabilization system protein ParE
VSLSAEARRDLRQIVDYYNLQRPGLGQRFVLAVVDRPEAVAETPGSFPQVYADLRRSIVRKFPYGIFYRTVDEVVRVVAIMHLHRDPESWRRRA